MQNSMIKNILKRFSATELVLLAYLILTLPLVVIQLFFNNSDTWTLFWHLLFMGVVVFMSYSRSRITVLNDRLKWLMVFYPLLFLGFLYKETDLINNLIFQQDLDFWFLLLDGALFGAQPSVEFSIYLPSPFFAEVMYFGYFAYYLLLIGVPLLLYYKRGFETTNKTVFIIIQSFIIYYLFFLLVPVAGPQFFLKGVDELPQGFLFGSAIRFIQDLGEAPTAAFPSSHVAMCLILIYITYKQMDKFWLWLLPIAFLLILSTVYIRAHYAVDIIAAFATAPLVYILSLKIYAILSQRYVDTN